MEPCEERTSTGAAQVPVLRGGVPPDPGPMEPLLQGAGALPVLPCACCPHRKGPGDPSRYRLAFPPSGQEQRDTAGPGCSPLSQASFWRRSWVTTETGSKTEALQSLKEKKKGTNCTPLASPLVLGGQQVEGGCLTAPRGTLSPKPPPIEGGVSQGHAGDRQKSVGAGCQPPNTLHGY